MPTPEKELTIQAAQKRLDGVTGIYLADFTGMTVEKLSLLRTRCREQGIQFHVIKNTLLKRAFNSNGITALDDHLVGPTGVVFSAASATSPAKVLADFAKEHERPRIKAAIVDGKFFDDKAIKVLASLPSREVLLSQVLATFIAPMTQFLALVNATLATPANMADALHRERSKSS